MDVKQIPASILLLNLLLNLLLLPLQVRSSIQPCYLEHELQDVAERKLHNQHLQQPEPAQVFSADSTVTCPVDRYQNLVEWSDRSLSPWRYVYNVDPDRFPSRLAVAQCLCSGCIVVSMKREHKVQEESMNYNSVPLSQSRLVFRKEACEDGNRFRLVRERVDVQVGCTCVRPKVRSV